MKTSVKRLKSSEEIKNMNKFKNMQFGCTTANENLNRLLLDSMCGLKLIRYYIHLSLSFEISEGIYFMVIGHFGLSVRKMAAMDYALH